MRVKIAVGFFALAFLLLIGGQSDNRQVSAWCDSLLVLVLFVAIVLFVIDGRKS